MNTCSRILAEWRWQETLMKLRGPGSFEAFISSFLSPERQSSRSMLKWIQHRGQSCSDSPESPTNTGYKQQAEFPTYTHSDSVLSSWGKAGTWEQCWPECRYNSMKNAAHLLSSFFISLSINLTFVSFQPQKKWVNTPDLFQDACKKYSKFVK